MLLAGNIFPDYLSGFAQLMSSLAGLEPQEARFIPDNIAQRPRLYPHYLGVSREVIRMLHDPLPESCSKKPVLLPNSRRISSLELRALCERKSDAEAGPVERFDMDWDERVICVVSRAFIAHAGAGCEKACRPWARRPVGGAAN